MKFGIIYELQMQKPWDENQEYKTYHEALDQVELADKVGFDYVWEVEHHFLVEYSHSSAPEVFLAAASQRTKNIRIGHGVALLPGPFNHPIRVAERAAALDIVSNGRVELGTGRSITEQELGGFNIDPADSRPMWEEAIQMIPKMWTTEEFSWEGDYFVVPPRNVLPKPVQKPHPPLWMACTQPDSFKIAGSKGLGALSFGFIAPGVLEASLGLYRDALKDAKPAGAFVNNNFAATTFACVAPTDEEALENGRPAAEFFQQSLGILFVPWAKKADVPSLVPVLHDAGADGRAAPGPVRRQRVRASVGVRRDRDRLARARAKDGADVCRRGSRPANPDGAGRTRVPRELRADDPAVRRGDHPRLSSN